MKPLQLAVVYKSNICPVPLFTSVMQDLADMIDFNMPYVIVGDFNTNVKDPQQETLITEICQTLRAKQLVTDATTPFDTTIDLIFSNDESITTGVIYCYFSHHRTVTACIPHY